MEVWAALITGALAAGTFLYKAPRGPRDPPRSAEDDAAEADDAACAAAPGAAALGGAPAAPKKTGNAEARAPRFLCVASFELALLRDGEYPCDFFYRDCREEEVEVFSGKGKGAGGCGRGREGARGRGSTNGAKVLKTKQFWIHMRKTMTCRAR